MDVGGEGTCAPASTFLPVATAFATAQHQQRAPQSTTITMPSIHTSNTSEDRQRAPQPATITMPCRPENAHPKHRTQRHAHMTAPGPALATHAEQPFHLLNLPLCKAQPTSSSRKHCSPNHIPSHTDCQHTLAQHSKDSVTGSVHWTPCIGHIFVASRSKLTTGGCHPPSGLIWRGNCGRWLTACQPQPPTPSRRYVQCTHSQ